jgi:hypothetical protein
MKQAIRRNISKKIEADRVQRAVAFLNSLEPEFKQVLFEELDKWEKSRQRGSRNKQR